MAQSKKLGITILVIIVAAIGVYSFKSRLFSNSTSPTDAATQRVKGNPNAPIKIIEYIDLQCPACANGAVILRDFVKRFPDKLYIQLKYFPLVTVHTHAIRSAVFADCAGLQGKFWPFFDLLMDRQSVWSKLTVADPEFLKIAQEVGLNEAALQTCVADKKTAETVYKDKEGANGFGIQSTPTYFINGKMIVGTKLLQEELNKLLAI